ncbi:endonuclease III [Candidatus Dojkabacteria bacterium]|nr:endonuclease III [Candidatus Dojkabacteria bacterium]
MTKKRRAALTLKKLYQKYSKYPQTGLKNWETPWQLLFCIIMSAQTTDDQVNEVTKKLFKRFRTLEDFANSDADKIGTAIRSTGFYNSKAKYLQKSAQIILKEFKGNVPRSIKELIKLPGVARKTANVYQQVMFTRSEGIAVDTHVARMSQRLRLTQEKTAVKIEKDLMRLFPKNRYHRINPILFWHGRTICVARKPQCEKCELSDFCPNAFKY